MSDPSGSALSCVSGEGTQGTVEAGGGVDLGWPRNQETSSSSFEGAPSCVDNIGVITWLKPVGEARADALWRKYFLSPNVRVPFPSLGRQFVANTEEDQGGMNFMYWPKVHISEGLRIPLPLLVHQFFHHTCLHPTHTHVNIICVLLGVCMLNF